MSTERDKQLLASRGMQSGVVPSFTQIKSMTTEMVPSKEGNKIKRIHDELNENAKPFQEMFNSIADEPLALVE